MNGLKLTVRLNRDIIGHSFSHTFFSPLLFVLFSGFSQFHVIAIFFLTISLYFLLSPSSIFCFIFFLISCSLLNFSLSIFPILRSPYLFITLFLYLFSLQIFSLPLFSNFHLFSSSPSYLGQCFLDFLIIAIFFIPLFSNFARFSRSVHFF